MLDTFLTILDVADKSTRLYDWVTGARFGKDADRALEARRVGDPDLIKISDHVIVDRRAREIVTANGSAELVDPRQLRALIDPVAAAVGGTVLTSQIVETPQRLRDAFLTDPWALLDDIRPTHRQMANNRPDWIPIAFWENGVEYVGYQKRGAIHAFGFDFVPGAEVADGPAPLVTPAPAQIAAPAGRAGPSFDDLNREIWATFGASVPTNATMIFGQKLDQARLRKLSKQLQFRQGEVVFGYVDTSAFIGGSYFVVFTEDRIAILEAGFWIGKDAYQMSYADFAVAKISSSWASVSIGNIRFKSGGTAPADLERLLKFLQGRLLPYYQPHFRHQL